MVKARLAIARPWQSSDPSSSSQVPSAARKLRNRRPVPAAASSMNDDASPAVLAGIRP